MQRAQNRNGQTVVIFVSTRAAADPEGYAAAAAAMETPAARQPDYRGMTSERGEAGLGITPSFRADEASAVAWRHHPEHVAIRERGRGDWYESCAVGVACIGRGHDWRRA